MYHTLSRAFVALSICTATHLYAPVDCDFAFRDPFADAAYVARQQRQVGRQRKATAEATAKTDVEIFRRNKRTAPKQVAEPHGKHKPF